MKEIVYRDVEGLVLLEDNPRKISDEQMERLKESIDKNPDYFECRPVILSDRTGELVVIAGNQRVKAATAIGLKAVPTILLSGLSEEREKEIIIRDNVNNGEWYDLIACEQLGRKCYMMELAPHYCDVIIARWEKLTGKKAEKING